MLLTSCGLPKSEYVMYYPKVDVSYIDFDSANIYNIPIETTVYYDPYYVKGYDFYYYIMSEKLYDSYGENEDDKKDSISSLAINSLITSVQEDLFSLTEKRNKEVFYKFVEIFEPPYELKHLFPIDELDFMTLVNPTEVTFEFFPPKFSLTNYAAVIEISIRNGDSVNETDANKVYMYRKIYDDIKDIPKEITYRNFDEDKSFFKYNESDKFKIDEDVNFKDDTDLQACANATSSDFYIAFFVVAYGNDNVKLKSLYSSPEIIGVQKLSISFQNKN